MPYVERQKEKYELPADSSAVLVLDVWAVHISDEFRNFMKEQYPFVHLVFVPPNCTSKLQVADVMLQKGFKGGIRKHFEAWVTQQISQQIEEGDIRGLQAEMKMKIIKPLVLSWCVGSWKALEKQRDLIKLGWHMCHVSLFNLFDEDKRRLALQECVSGGFEREQVPKANGRVPKDKPYESEPEADSSESEGEDGPNLSDTDAEKDELDTSKPIRQGVRRAMRRSAARKHNGLFFDPCMMDFTYGGDDPEATGFNQGSSAGKKRKTQRKN
jgi:hypothetical protein